MSREKARWMLACAVAKYLEGSRLLRVHARYLDDSSRLKIEATRQDFKTVINETVKRLTHETLA